MQHHDVIVIGGGQAGLAAGRRLQEEGLDFRILEAQPEAGGSWPNYLEPVRYYGNLGTAAMAEGVKRHCAAEWVG